MIRCTTAAAALLLCIGLCQAARDEGADQKGVLQAGGREAGLETIGVDTNHFTRRNTIAKAAKHSSRANGDGNTTNAGDEDHDEEHLSDDDGTETESSSAEHLSDNGSGSDAEAGSPGTSASGTEEGANSLAEETVDREKRPQLCNLDEEEAGKPGLNPTTALAKIEACVTQLENIKEGTLQQGKNSWHHNNEYVKKLADMENRMTELARPEPFEIAFAVDQADMFDKLKNRLQAITLDLPKLQGKDAGELPGIPKEPEESEAPKAAAAPAAEEDSERSEAAAPAAEEESEPSEDAGAAAAKAESDPGEGSDGSHDEEEDESKSKPAAS